MFDRFKKFIAENNLIKPGDRILLAVSGGIDSMIMADLFLQFGNEVGIAHCNFSLRGIESDKDEELIRKFASDHNIPFYSTQFETKAYAKKNGLSVQMAARELRYTWFEEIRKTKGYDNIAVAHNLNDNIETLIINLIRGTGIAGLTGMRPSGNKIIRPLLFATRQDITDYCNEKKLIFREDKSNAETKYTRNKIRHLIIPVLKEINPSIETTLNETAERLTGINEIVSEFISVLKDRISVQKGEFIAFNVSQLKLIHNKAALFELFKPYGVTDAMLKDLISVIEGRTGAQIFTSTHWIIKNRQEIIVSHEVIGDDTYWCIENIRELRNVPVIASARYVKITEKFEIPADSHIACIDSEIISFPFIIRKWKAGDYFYPLGMKQKKKLSDYFIDKKYSRFDKENILVMESGGRVVWIIGDRIDNRFRITNPTKKALVLKSLK